MSVIGFTIYDCFQNDSGKHQAQLLLPAVFIVILFLIWSNFCEISVTESILLISSQKTFNRVFTVSNFQQIKKAPFTLSR